MENSNAYRYLINQINATGSEKLDGYDSKVMEKIFDWERDEVEAIIWKTFHQKKDMDLAPLLPKLKKYDGVKALKKMLQKCIIPSWRSVIISQTLYEHTGNDKYLDIIKKNIDKDANEISYVAMLSYCKPCKKSYDLLVDIYCNSDNKTIRSTAVSGILYNKGFITDPDNLQEMTASVELRRKFIADDVNERRMIIKMLETGQMEKYRK